MIQVTLVTNRTKERLAREGGWPSYKALRDDLGGSIMGQYIEENEPRQLTRPTDKWSEREIALTVIVHGRLFTPAIVKAQVSTSGRTALVDDTTYEEAIS